MEEKKTWLKKGGGTFTLKNKKVIQPGQKFKATESEIPKAFRDVIVPVEPAKPKPKTKSTGSRLKGKSGKKAAPATNKAASTEEKESEESDKTQE